MRVHLWSRGVLARRAAILLPTLAVAGLLIASPAVAAGLGIASPLLASVHHQTERHTAVHARLTGTVSSTARSLRSHGQLLHLAPSLGLNTNQSNNWFGYNQGTLEQGGKLFNSITGNWTVPTATQHTKGQAESSSDWIGIGGGCVDASCTVTDNTLIQTGTEQDVSSAGKASY